MYQLSNLIIKLEKELTKYKITESINLKISTIQNYDFQINNLVKFQKNKEIEKLKFHFLKLLKMNRLLNIMK